MQAAGPLGVRGHDTIAIGASAGGLEALRQLLAALPGELAIALFVAVHLPSDWNSGLPQLLQSAGRYPARFARDGESITRGTIRVAPPNHHLLLLEDRVRVTRSRRESFWRPSIDVLFRSAAVSYGPQVVGVILSGALDDGAAGLAAIARCAGITLIQEPHEAAVREMPQAALRAVPAAEVLPARGIGARIAVLATQSPAARVAVPEELRRGVLAHAR